jgi:hypothetical protein
VLYKVLRVLQEHKDLKELLEPIARYKVIPVVLERRVLKELPEPQVQQLELKVLKGVKEPRDYLEHPLEPKELKEHQDQLGHHKVPLEPRVLFKVLQDLPDLRDQEDLLVFRVHKDLEDHKGLRGQKQVGHRGLKEPRARKELKDLKDHPRMLDLKRMSYH